MRSGPAQAQSDRQKVPWNVMLYGCHGSMKKKGFKKEKMANKTERFSDELIKIAKKKLAD